jgi:hypothetical protein
MASGVPGILEGISTNLAFALPSPWGPIGAAGLGGLFGLVDLFGGGGPSIADLIKAVSDMIQQAVSELEGYMRQLNVEKAQSDAATFFEWYRDNISGQDDTALTDADVATIETTILPKLEEANSFLNGSLLNDLVSMSSDSYVRADTPVDRKDDAVLSVLLMTMTALIAALKLNIRLHAAIASLCAPVDGRCQTKDDDEKFQVHTQAWLNATATLTTLIGTKAPADPRYWDEIADVRHKDPQLSYKLSESIDKVLPQPLGITWVTNDFRFPPTLPTLSISDLLADFGWGGALRELVTHRLLRRLREFYPVDMDEHDAYIFWDNLAKNGHGESPRTPRGEAITALRYNFGTQAKMLFDSRTGAETFGSDLDVIDGWGKGLAQIRGLLPPDPQGNTAVVSTWAADPPPTGSRWLTAVQVQYAFSYRSPTNGPSLRNAWGAPFDVAKQWKPKLRHIQSGLNGADIEVWRRFAFLDKNGEASELGLPEIVAALPAATTEYVDDDPALSPV